MINVMRSNQRWLMILISVLVIISFIWFFSNRTQVDRMVSDKAGSIYGRSMTTSELEREVRALQTAQELGLRNQLRPEIFDQRDATTDAVNRLVLQHQVDAFRIAPTDEEVMAAEQGLPIFQTNGAFDSAKYGTYVTDKLGARGFTQTEVDSLVRFELQIEKLRQIVNAAVVVSGIETRAIYEQAFTKTDASVVRFPIADVAASIQPSDADIKKYFDDPGNSTTLQQPEKRQVEYIKFGLDDAARKLTGKARMDALQPHADQADQFLENLLDHKDPDGFAKLAEAEHLPVQTTVAFEQAQQGGLPEASIPQFTSAAFRLTAADPDSDVPLETSDAFYVLHLKTVTPARPLTLEEARPRIVAALKDERGKAALAAKAEEARSKITAALAAGSSFADAAKAAGLAAQDVPAFAVTQPPPATVPDGSAISEASLPLAPGEVSKFVPTGTGGLLVYVRGREPLDDQQFAQKLPMLSANLLENKQRLYFYEWLKASKDAADVRLLAPGRG